MSEVSHPIPFHIAQSQGTRAYAAQSLTPGRRTVVPSASQFDTTSLRHATPRLPSPTICLLYTSDAADE